ncbi:MAG: serine/threonine-protein kinase [Planctomycetota bacterium]|jgi:serine/threonine protein kinase
MSTLREGERISNYLLEVPLGAGSFGEVWRARHHVFNEVVAIKIPTDPQFVRNLRREGLAVHGLRHPNIVRAIDLDPYADPPYLVMEYVEGPSLRRVIDELKAAIPVKTVIAIMRGVLHGLQAAHEQGMVHRDVKPANILLNHPLDQVASVTEQSVKITDFGLGSVGGVTTQSIMQSGSMMTEDGRSVAGTLAYMSPEQKEGGELDGRSDLYACGIVLFELLTGERPQGNDVPSLLRPEVPGYLDQVFKRCYTRRERRYAGADEMLEAMTGEAMPQPPAPPPRVRSGGKPRWVPPGGEPHCPACDRVVHRDDQFCIHCGRQLVEAVPRCPSCQAYVQSRDLFCIYCGTNLQVLA